MESKDMELTSEQLTRYSRHFILPEIGEEGQKKLLRSKVLLIGSGGLGSPIALYLAAAGVGTLGLVDFDKVDLSNLQRQIIHTNDAIGTPKIDSAEKRIKAMNPDTKVVKYEVKITSANALEIIRDYDLVIDGTDNFPTRYLTSDACVFLNKPNIYGSIFRFDGLATVFKADEGPCYRCLYPEPPPPGMVPSCAEGGVLGILPGVIGLIQATEAVKILCGIGRTLVGRLLVYDALQMTFRELKLKKDPNCPVCGKNPVITSLIDYDQFCGLTRGGASDGIADISVEELKKKLDQREDFFFLDVREPFEYQIARIEGARLIPLGAIPDRAGELEPYREKEIVAICHHGGRSRRALQMLQSRGFKKLKNVAGGIDHWSDRIDPAVARY
ncbi:MAG: molybdopterin-synthase adenylyltransferase MoeB [Candidatus Omnitrophica bacterium]|nr:molybdopterin-synthase adenylyltransferase MoeB [Candidatus Omnitrophota bacterium]